MPNEAPDFRGAHVPDQSADPWWSAIEVAFNEFNQVASSHSDGLGFVQQLPEDLRYALVCFLYEAEHGNGGLDLVFSCIGLLIPEIVAGLRFFGCAEQADQLDQVRNRLPLGDYTQDHDTLMQAWDALASEIGDEFCNGFSIQHTERGYSRQLRSQVEAAIAVNPQRFFKQAG